MKRILVLVVGSVLALSGAAGARADVDNASATNVQDGQNTSSSSQSGKGNSGDAVGGQVAGVVSGGRASVDARNTSRDSTISTGSVDGTNSAASFVGLNSSPTTTVIADVTNACNAAACDNIQDGSNRYSLAQTLGAISGDGVGGQVIGLVATRSADPSIVASNTTDGVDVDTGEADGTNSAAAFVGLNESASATTITADLDSLCTGNECHNLQDGSNRLRSRQSADAHSGDGVAGQVIGAVTSSRTSVDATNRTNDSAVDTGDATADNSAAYFVGLNASDDGLALTGDVSNSCEPGCDNVQDGSNRASAAQTARASSGDGVAGEVIGVVGSGGGVSVVAANTSTDSDVETGDGEATNDLAAFVGLNESDSGPALTADVTNSCSTECENVQDGSNTFTGSQTARSSSGDGVAGQVLGVVAAGNASLDATNRSDGVSVDTGNTDAHNDAAVYVGLNTSDFGPTLTAESADVSSVTAVNLQDGRNSKTLSQNADASSGDAVAGQVSGVVTAAGGSASLVLANTSADIDASTGESEFSNDESSFVGLNFSTSTVLG